MGRLTAQTTRRNCNERYRFADRTNRKVNVNMFILKKVVINKYKSYSSKQVVELEDDITTLVGKNESGKTAFLEALAKLNYFTDDEAFKFDEVQDYPRNELKRYQRTGEDVEPIVCTFQLDQETIDEINEDLGEGILTTDSFSVSTKYKNGRTWYYINCDEKKYRSEEH